LRKRKLDQNQNQQEEGFKVIDVNDVIVSDDDNERRKQNRTEGGKILICCGLHSGYRTVKRFFELATSPEFGFQSELIEIRRMPKWGEINNNIYNDISNDGQFTIENFKKKNQKFAEDLEKICSVEDRNRTVLVYLMTLK